MKILTGAVLACMTLAAGSVAAQDAKKAPMKPMTMQDCKDYMATAKKDASKKDAAKETACTDMMNKEKAKK